MAWIIQNTCIFQVVIVYQSISYYITWGRTSIRPVELALNLPRNHGCASDWVVCDPDKKSIIESKWGDSIWWDYTYIYTYIHIYIYTHVYIYIYILWGYGDISYILHIFGDIPSITPGTIPFVVLPLADLLDQRRWSWMSSIANTKSFMMRRKRRLTGAGSRFLWKVKECHVYQPWLGNGKLILFIPPIYLWWWLGDGLLLFYRTHLTIVYNLSLSLSLVYLFSFIYIYIYNYIYMHSYIHTYWEREREKERESNSTIMHSVANPKINYP